MLNYKTFGQGEPIIILHGLFGTLDNWQTLARQWAEEYSIYLLDLRNHGRSPHLDTISYPEMAEDVRHFMEDNWIYEATVLGHSMGGKVAMELALHYPDLVKRLIVVDIAPKVYSHGHEAIFNALQSLDLTTLQSREEADSRLAEQLTDYSVRQFLLKNLTREKTGHYRWKMNLPVIAGEYTNILKNITGTTPFPHPALFIRGGQSDYITDADWPTIEGLFPQARLETVAQAGHWVHAEAPAELDKLVQAFLQENS